MRRPTVGVLRQGAPSSSKRRRSSPDDQDAIELESRLAAYSVSDRSSSPDTLRARFRPPPPAPPPVRETFATRYTADSLFVTDSPPATDPERDTILDLRTDVEQAAAVLGVRPDTQWDEIVRAHRALARVHHPDRHIDEPEVEQRAAEALMADVNMAYSVLRRRVAGASLAD